MTLKAQNTACADRPRVAVDVVIVNWNSGSLLKDCLASLDQATDAEDLHVIVVDNASTDGSASGLSAGRLILTVLANTANVGFGSACNQGAKAGNAPAILFLNPDVRVLPETIERADCYLTSHTDVGVLGVQLLDVDGNVTRSCARRPTTASLLLQALLLDRILGPPLTHFVTEWDHRDTRTVDQVSGAFLFIRRLLFENLGGFDNRFFVYYEDLDLCMSVLDSSAKVVYYNGTGAIHSGGGTTNAVKGRRLFYSFRSRVEYAAKRHGRTTAVVILALIILIELPVRFVQTLVGAGSSRASDIAEAASSFIRETPKLLRRVFTVL